MALEFKYDTESNTYSRIKSDTQIDKIFDKCYARIRQAYAPIVKLSRDTSDRLAVEFITKLIKAESFYKENNNNEYKILLTYILYAVYNGACGIVSDRAEEDLLDYTDRFGRIEAALDYIMTKQPSYIKLIEMYSDQIYNYFECKNNEI